VYLLPSVLSCNRNETLDVAAAHWARMFVLNKAFAAVTAHTQMAAWHHHCVLFFVEAD